MMTDACEQRRLIAKTNLYYELYIRKREGLQ